MPVAKLSDAINSMLKVSTKAIVHGSIRISREY